MLGLVSPRVRKKVARSMAQYMKSVLGYPAMWPYIETNDDFSVRYGWDYSDIARKLFREKTGIDAPVPPEVAKAIKKDVRSFRGGNIGKIDGPRGVVSEDDPWLQWSIFTTKDIGGGYNKTLNEAAKKVIPNVHIGPIPGGMQWPLWQVGQYPPHDFGANGFNLLQYYYYLCYWQPLIGNLYWDEVARMANRKLPLWVVSDSFSYDEPSYYRNTFFFI